MYHNEYLFVCTCYPEDRDGQNSTGFTYNYHTLYSLKLLNNRCNVFFCCIVLLRYEYISIHSQQNHNYVLFELYQAPQAPLFGNILLPIKLSITDLCESRKAGLYEIVTLL